MRVLLQIRPEWESRPGGDTVHARETARALAALGVEAEISGAWAPDLSDYALVHLFNTQIVGATVRHAIRARGWGLPIVFSPIYWDTSRVRPPGTEREHVAMQALALALADRVLPSSQAETELLRQTFSGLDGRLAVVPIAPGPMPRGDGDRFCARHGVKPRGFVLCTGRKETRKNQLPLIAACADLGIPLVLAGWEAPDDDYPERCRQLAAELGADVLFLPYVDDEEVADAYAAARVHALPSIYETVGLSTLEAALAGCNVVTTQEAGIPDYLGDGAWYCDPSSEGSIRDAVARAWAAPLGDGLARRVAGFTWARTAEQTLVAYEAAMADHEARGDWKAPLPRDQYVAHLEELVQLQLEAIAMRDEQFAEHARDAEANAGRVEAHARRMEEHARRVDAHAEELAARVAVAEGELARLQATRLFRWTATARRAYAAVRRGARGEDDGG